LFALPRMVVWKLYVVCFTYKFIFSWNLKKLASLKKCSNIWRMISQVVKQIITDCTFRTAEQKPCYIFCPLNRQRQNTHNCTQYKVLTTSKVYNMALCHCWMFTHIQRNVTSEKFTICRQTAQKNPRKLVGSSRTHYTALYAWQRTLTLVQPTLV
jgi:hypothetical protein